MNRPIVCYVTDRRSLPVAPGVSRETALIKLIGEAAHAGVDWIQLREKDLEARPLFDLARQAIAACGSRRDQEPRANVLINDRLDVAWASQAAGVHLGESSMPVDSVVREKRRIGRAGFLVGASCHSRRAALDAAAAGADYIFFGPVFDTPSKSAFGAAQGVERLAEVCRAVSIPVVAIGGITEEKSALCLDAGAAGIAAIRMFQRAPQPDGDLAALVRQFRQTGPALRGIAPRPRG